MIIEKHGKVSNFTCIRLYKIFNLYYNSYSDRKIPEMKVAFASY